MLKLNIKPMAVLIFFIILSVAASNSAYSDTRLLGEKEYQKIQNKVIGLEKAVKIYPSNTHIRMRLGHLYLKLNELEKALEQFKEIVRLRPRDYKAALELGYLYRKRGEEDLAEEQFERVAQYGKREVKEKAKLELEDIARTRVSNEIQELEDNFYAAYHKGDLAGAAFYMENLLERQPENAFFRADLGRVYLALGKYEKAIKELEFLKAQNQLSYEGRVDLGDAYAHMDKRKLARKEYTIVATGKNPRLAKEARKRLKVLEEEAKEEAREEAREKAREEAKIEIEERPRHWISSETTFYDRFSNVVFELTARQFLFRKKLPKPLEIYLEENFIRDTKSKGGELADIHSDNIVQMGLGIRVRPFPTQYLYLYAIGYGGRRLVKEVDDSWDFGDFRSGINYYRGWGTLYLDKVSEKAISPLIMKEWGEFNSDLSYYDRFGRNLIAYIDVKEGLKLLQIKARDLDGYLCGNTIVDRRGEYYNNVVEGGVGVRYQLIPQSTFCYLSCEQLWGRYLGRQTLDDPNPYRDFYHDLRLQLTACYQW